LAGKGVEHESSHSLSARNAGPVAVTKEERMKKIAIAPGLFSPPMPVALVGANVDGKPNFMTAAWLTRANFDPPMVAVALNAGHLTTQGILQNKTFSVCLPGADLMEKTDYCGIVSGARAEKAGLFSVSYGDLETAPLADDCPICAECALAQTIQLPSNLLFIGNVAAVHADPAVLVDGQPDPEKLAPLLLTMPDNHYRLLGGAVGKAWSSGRSFRKE
jgi:flavin reductase (DIM6/NTAB) family NADH-FMN oxidoreductase RutF